MASLSGGNMDNTATQHSVLEVGGKRGACHKAHLTEKAWVEEGRQSDSKLVTGHVACPLVALEVEQPSGLSDVLRRLLLLHLHDLLLGIFTQEVHTWGRRATS